MVASAPPHLPVGYLSLEHAIDHVGRHLLKGKWTGNERQAVNEARDLMAPAIAKHTRRVNRFAQGKAASPPRPFKSPPLPALLREAFLRRQDAFGRLCKLCAYGGVSSVLLLDDYTVGNAIPPRNWLDNGTSADMLRTGRTTVRGEHSSAWDISGWVMIDERGLAAALAMAADGAPLQAPPHHDQTATVDELLRNNERGRALIHEAIRAVYELAESQGVKAPNVREVIKPVQKWLCKHKRCNAAGSLIEELAGGEPYGSFRRKPGAPVRGTLRPVDDLEI